MNAEKVFNYMTSIEQNEQDAIHDSEFKNSLDYKLKCLNNEKENAKCQCLEKIFEKFYTKCLPLSDDYKDACDDELKSDIKGYIEGKGCKDISYFVNEAKLKGSKCAARIMESVENLVDDIYQEAEMNIDKIEDLDDMVFKMDDATEKRIDLISQNLELDDLAQIISDNVKSTALSEIKRAKQEKENNKALEKELADDMSITSEAAIDNALALRRLNQRIVFQPSLFEGIMIGKMNHADVMLECAGGTMYLHNALEDYGFKTDPDHPYASAEELAFTESVREYTLLNMSKALRLENFSLNTIREMAQDYAQL